MGVSLPGGIERRAARDADVKSTAVMSMHEEQC